MKKLITVILPFTVFLCGCTRIGDKTASLSIVYAIAAMLAIAILSGYCIGFRSKLANKTWFIFLFSSVAAVNIGYYLLSVSKSLTMALWANRIAYLGSVFLPLSMLMIILHVTNTQYKKWLTPCLFILSGIVLFIAASPGWLTVYYKEVTLNTAGSATTLDKVYGPLHVIYLFFLLGYFIAMVSVIVRAAFKKRVDSAAHSIFLVIAVFSNIGVWLIEQISDIELELLAISYIISELFLLGVHLLVSENQRLKTLVDDSSHNKEKYTDVDITVDNEKLSGFLEGVETLTQTERRIFNAYVARATTKEIMSQLCITENTLKFHNKNIYTKLGVRSRKELLEIYKQMQ